MDRKPWLTAEGLETAVHEGFPASCSSRKSSHLHWQMVHAANADELAPLISAFFPSSPKNSSTRQILPCKLYIIRKYLPYITHYSYAFRN
jgi:hypothetical protein